jgi:hypothetical protein
VSDLLERGYSVDAFDAAPSLVEVARSRFGERARFCAFSFDELSQAVLDASDNAAHVFVKPSYDAVLLGWGSLSHVPRAQDRFRLLRALHTLCPRGPLLASFWCRGMGASAPRPTGRAHRLGKQVGRAIRKIRRLDGQADPQGRILPHVGFVHTFEPLEVESLAAELGRVLHWDVDDGIYPHVTFSAPSE